MPTARRAVPAVLAGVLLLAACGSESASPGGDGRVGVEASCPSDFSPYGSAPPTAGPPDGSGRSGTPTPLPLPSPDGTAEGDVAVTGLYAWGNGSGCEADFSADFEVTNSGTQKAAYTVTLGFFSSSGTIVDHVERTVAPVGPGRTVKGSAGLGASLGDASDVSNVKVEKVRSVPVAEASSASGPCPASGVRLYADEGDAAMGLRVVGLHLVNCGTRTYRLNGYPELEILDEDHAIVDSVRILHGTDRISTGTGGSGSPQPVVLRPGEAAEAGLAWRNTTGAGDPVNAPYVRVRAKPGARPVMVVPELDLGTTGQLGVGPWKKDETYRDPAATAPTQQHTQ
ncbi:MULTISPECIES: DUF4232 domain-containing protein [unclassified Streptomyces]|uniref:DUF4232 domain-containing protein n=1 Tax=unclassified Streptomyces TaxID=2593676 RepID=UPI00236664C8|nr:MULTISPECIES: DUF4232 domain-containing protein [unclassified Streptomyces]MDF3144823.1 DUF4232 domain-containing protein [Streptomyces sp. T21Q-yed]WDF38518.1 DUF4232 domain-containing protein [Streptomyces sp. T12]